MARPAIQQVVGKLVRQHGTSDPFRLCKYLGIRIHYTPLGDIKGVYFQHKRITHIFLNEDLDEPSLRVACAHELGHIMLAHTDNKFFLATKTLRNTAKPEVAADTFAAYLLLPDDEYEDMLSREYSIEQIARETGLPQRLVALRT